MNNQEPLVEWNYSMEEWDQFIDIEKGNKKIDNVYFGFAILILTPFVLMFLRGTSFWTGLLYAIPFAFLIPFLRVKFAYKHLQKGVHNPRVKIYQDFILVNDKKIELASSRRRIKSAKIINASNGRKLLEIDIQWLTGKGPTNDEYRFLIPKGEDHNAQRLVNLVHQ